jgi:hypothetical protein
MTDDFDDDTQEKLIKAFVEYSKWNERFERFGYKGSALQARAWLSEIRRMASLRRKEIQAKKNIIHGIGQDQEETDDDATN